jgi:hypothetical protein
LKTVAIQLLWTLSLSTQAFPEFILLLFTIETAPCSP